MSPNSSTHVKQTDVYAICGYDLIGFAIQKTLAEIELDVQILSLAEWIECIVPRIRTLILDDAAFESSSFKHFLITRADYISSTSIILIDSMIHSQRIWYAAQLGIRGHLYLGDKLTIRLKQAVRDIMEGGTYYSPSIVEALTSARQIAGKTLPRINDYHRQILQGMAAHQAAGEIGRSLGRSAQAIYQVQSYLRGMFNVDTNSELLEIAEKWGVIQRQT